MTRGTESPVAPSDKEIALGVKGYVVGLAPPAAFPQPPATLLRKTWVQHERKQSLINGTDEAFPKKIFIADMEFHTISIYFAPEVRKTWIDN